MRVTVVVGGVVGFLTAVVFTLFVMEQHEEFGETSWVVAATFKPGPGYRSVWLFLGVTAVLPVVFGGVLGDCAWSWRAVRMAVAGSVLAGVLVWAVSYDLAVKHGQAGTNTRGALALDAVFIGGVFGAKVAERWGRGKGTK